MKFRFPKQQKIFIYPVHKKIPDLINANKSKFSTYNFSINGIRFGVIRKKLRTSLAKILNLDLNSKPIVGCAHQPGFLPPGVIRKFIFVNSLKHVLGINFIMDNDYSKYVNWEILVKEDRIYKLKRFFLVRPIVERPLKFIKLPKKERILDILNQTRQDLESLEEKRLVKNCIKLEQIIKSNYKDDYNLPFFLNDICFKYININSLKSILTSKICQTQEYHIYVKDIINNIIRFNRCYNDSLGNFRKKYGIRNNNLPFPNLKIEDDLYELPFWFIDYDRKIRRPCYVRKINSTKSILTLDLKKKEVIKLEDVRINMLQPKAVTFTILLRMFYCDLFVHGVGGANYEEVTDNIIQSYYGVSPPYFLVVTETKYLPFTVDDKLQTKLEKAQNRLRKINQAPHKFLSDEDKLVNRKRKLVDKIREVDKSKKVRISYQIKQVDKELLKKLKPEIGKLKKRISLLQKRAQQQKILTYRNYPYFLFNYG